MAKEYSPQLAPWAVFSRRFAAALAGRIRRFRSGPHSLGLANVRTLAPTAQLGASREAVSDGSLRRKPWARSEKRASQIGAKEQPANRGGR